MPTIKSKNKQSMGFDGTYDSDEYDLVPKITPKKSSAKKNNTIVNLISDTDDGAAVATPSKGSSKKSTSKETSATPTRASRSASKSKVQRASATQSSTSDDEDSDEELVPLAKLGSARKNRSQRETPILPPLRTYGKKDKGKKVISKDNHSSDDDPIVSSPKRSQKPAYKLKSPPTAQDDDDDDEEDDIRSSPVKRRLRQPFVRNEEEEEEEENEPRVLSPLKRVRPTVETDEDEEDVDESPTKRRRRGTQQVVDSDDEPVTPVRGSLSRGTRGRQLSIGRRSLSRTQSQHSSPARTTRLQKGKKKHRTAREKQMEILRRRKNGDNSELTESESESESGSDEFQKLEEFDDEEEEEEEELSTRKTAKAQRKSATPGENQDDLDEFVVDDDEDDIGVPEEALMGIPLEFTHHAHKKLVEHFKDAVEWMVHNKINPGFPRNDPIYKQAFRKLDDEASGLAKSKFTSTQWTQEFTKAVYARPVLEMLPLQAGEGFDLASGLAKCFACNHRGHTSSIALCLTGKAYDRTTLEDIDQGSDDSDKSSKDSDAEDSSDDDDEHESKSVNSQGASIPPQSKRFPAGSVCRKNTEYAHQLIHWKYNLNQWVISALEVQGELTPEKLVERDAMNSKKRTKYTNAVVDDWADNGQVKELWSDYKRVLETARNLTAQGRGGWK